MLWSMSASACYTERTTAALRTHRSPLIRLLSLRASKVHENWCFFENGNLAKGKLSHR